MLAYLDSSVVLAKAFDETLQLEAWNKVTYAVSSELVRLECLRAVERYRSVRRTEDQEYLGRLGILHKMLGGIELLRVSSSLLQRAAQPFPLPLKTLDAIHLTTAILYREQHAEEELVFCCHDQRLRDSAAALGFKVLG